MLYTENYVLYQGISNNSMCENYQYFIMVLMIYAINPWIGLFQRAQMVFCWYRFGQDFPSESSVVQFLVSSCNYLLEVSLFIKHRPIPLLFLLNVLYKWSTNRSSSPKVDEGISILETIKIFFNLQGDAWHVTCEWNLQWGSEASIITGWVDVNLKFERGP